MPAPSPAQLRRASAIAAEIAALGFTLPGSLAARLTRCGTPGCRCHDPEQAVLHGPYPTWTRKVAGRSVTRRLTAEQFEAYQSWFTAHRRLRELVAELEELSLEIIEAELRPDAGTAKPQAPRPRKTPAS